MLFFAVTWGTARQASALTATFEVNGETKTESDIFGQSDCLSDKKIIFTWKFTPSGTPTANSTTVRYKLWIGGSDTTSGVVIFEDDFTFSATTTSTEQSVSYTSAVNKANLDQEGFVDTTEKILTLKDIIGYKKVQDGEDPSDTAAWKSNICNLFAPATDGVQEIPLYITMKYDVTKVGTTGTNTTETEEIDGEYRIRFDLTPPPAPSTPTITAGDKSILLKWEQTDNDATYEVYYSANSFTSTDPAGEGATKATCDSTTSLQCRVTGLENDKTYYFALRAIDASQNKGVFSAVVSGKPVDYQDFYEGYRAAGGKDAGFSGGYCFIATAAYGSYDNKYVQILRDFRDQYLLTNAPGKAFVAWYYHNGPIWANWIRRHPTAKRGVQVLLLPTIAFAAFFVKLPGWLHWGLLLLLLTWYLRRRINLRSAAALGILFFGLSGLPSNANAKAKGSPRNFGFELRLGPYTPQINQEGNLGQNTPYTSFFGNGPQLMIEGGLEWLIFKGFGSVGIGGSIGFTWASGEAKAPGTNTGGLTSVLTQNQTTTEETTSNQTGFQIVPLRFDISYRFDYFAQKNGFPLVPYIRGGLDYYIWWVTDSNGALATYTDGGKTDTAIGGRLGFHFAVGVQFLLDVVEPRAARTFDVEFGVNHTYLFAEWHMSWVGVVTPGMNLSDSMIRAGLMLQF
tara:strand:+ start:2016 stop:4058 length:2043 start_codon:yes stop_codon:yes gene_type:complete